jgi:hypothetical protein
LSFFEVTVSGFVAVLFAGLAVLGAGTGAVRVNILGEDIDGAPQGCGNHEKENKAG